jgi:hypothetical protein
MLRGAGVFRPRDEYDPRAAGEGCRNARVAAHS